MGGVRIEGYASLWGVADLNGDVVHRGAFTESLAKTGAEGVRMLWQHDGREIIGRWTSVAEDDRGLFVDGVIEDFSAQSRMAQAVCKAGAVDGLSIGYRAAKATKRGRLRILSKVGLWEVSVVTFPACPGARLKIRQSEAA